MSTKAIFKFLFTAHGYEKYACEYHRASYPKTHRNLFAEHEPAEEGAHYGLEEEEQSADGGIGEQYAFVPEQECDGCGNRSEVDDAEDDGGAGRYLLPRQFVDGGDVERCKTDDCCHDSVDVDDERRVSARYFFEQDGHETPGQSGDSGKERAELFCHVHAVSTGDGDYTDCSEDDG